jgi:hypothetical protein
MNSINGIPLRWDAIEVDDLFGKSSPVPGTQTGSGMDADPLEGISTNKSFEEMSTFNYSPFGQNWDKHFVLSDRENQKYKDDPPQSQWIYHLEKNADGRKLIDLYQHDSIISPGYGSGNDELTDIGIYYETDDRYNSFGSICFVKMNGALADYLRKYNNGRQWLTDEVAKKEENIIDAVKLREAIDYELDTGGGMDIVAKIGAKLVLKLGEIIRDLKYRENVWNPELNNYDPILPIADLDKMVKKWNNFKRGADKFFVKAKETGAWLSENIPLLGEFLQSCTDMVADIFSAIINAIDQVIQAIDKILRILKLANAFIAGVINECIELAAGLVDLVALLLTITDKAERQKIREALENILESYRREPSKIPDQLKQGFEELQQRYSSDKSEYQIAYQLGEDAVTVISWIGLIGGIIKGVKNLPKALTKLEAWAKKAAKRISAVEFSKVGEALRVLRFKYIKKPIINLKWRVYVNYAELSKSGILALQKIRQEFGLLNKNVATLKVRVVTKEGRLITKEYIAHAGKGKKIPNSTGSPQAKPPRDFMDYEYNQKRWFDSENKMLMQMDKDLEPYTVLQMTMEWESTFTPCTICKREILIRRELYKAKVFVKSPKFKNAKGKKIHVINSKDFKKLLEQSK